MVEERQDDALILVDLDDQMIGSENKLAVHQKGLLHRAFSVFLFDGDRLLLQKRAACKYHSAGLWTNTCCSHPRTGESLEGAIRQRLPYECGIHDVPVHAVGSLVYRACFENGLIEYEYDHIFIGAYSGFYDPRPDEIKQMQWVTLDQLKADLLVHPSHYTAWFVPALHIALQGKR